MKALESIKSNKTIFKLKNVIFIIIMIASSSLLANDLFQIEIPEGHKLEATYSVSIDQQNSTFHLVIFKEKNKGYKMIPIFVDSSSEVKEMEMIAFDALPTFVSHHANGSIITLVGIDGDSDQMSILDIDTSTGQHRMKIEEEKEVYKTIFRLENRSVLVRNTKRGKSLVIKEVINSDTLTNSIIDIGDDIRKEFKNFTKLYPEAINRNEYVKTGSIGQRKSYISDHTITFTLDENSTGTKTLEFNWDDLSVKSKSFETSEMKRIKDYTSYLYDDVLFTIASSKKDLVLNAFDFNTGEKRKSLSLKQKISRISGDFNATIEFLKTGGKSKMKPTVTINKSKNNKMVVRLDNVEKTTYQYHYNWWFHHWMFQNHMWHVQQQQMQMQMNSTMQMIQNNNRAMNRFTPNGEFYDRYYNVLGTFKEETTAIEFVLDENLELMPFESSTETQYNKIDKTKPLEKFNDNKNYKQLTASFTESEMRYIYMDRQSKVVYLKTEKL